MTATIAAAPSPTAYLNRAKFALDSAEKSIEWLRAHSECDAASTIREASRVLDDVRFARRRIDLAGGCPEPMSLRLAEAWGYAHRRFVDAFAGARSVMTGLLAPMVALATMPPPGRVRIRPAVDKQNEAIMRERVRRFVTTRSSDVAIAAPTTAPAETGGGAFAGIAAEGAAAAAQAGLVRGGVRPTDVNPIAGYNVPVVARRGEATRYAGAAIPTDANPQSERKIERTDIIAGAKSAGSGILIGWSGAGELSRGAIVDALQSVGLPVEWAPRSKSAHAQAGHAISTLTNTGHVVRAERGARRDRHGIRAYRARWTVGVVSHTGAVNDSFGRTVLVATLHDNDELRLAHDETDPDAVHLARRVAAEYRRRIDAESFTSAEVTMWLRATITDRYYAVRVGGMYYVPRRNADAAERLCTALASDAKWGSDWMLPALPVSTSEQLRAGLATGFVAEANAVLADLEAARAAAKAAGRSDVGTRAAATLLLKLRDVAQRALMYQAILGDDQLATVRTAVVAAIAVIEPLADDTSQRGALIWDELAK